MTTGLITGCSSGLARGDNAVVTARDAANVKDLADGHPATAPAVALNVTDQVQVAAAVGQVFTRR
jgi:NADP-dependent 3-hydroxy acid dehydrogenase YdfG